MNKKKYVYTFNTWLALKNVAAISSNVCEHVCVCVQSNPCTSEIDTKHYNQYGSTSK